MELEAIIEVSLIVKNPWVPNQSLFLIIVVRILNKASIIVRMVDVTLIFE